MINMFNMAQLLSMASASQNPASLASSTNQQAAAIASLAAAGIPSTMMPPFGAFGNPLSLLFCTLLLICYFKCANNVKK